MQEIMKFREFRAEINQLETKKTNKQKKKRIGKIELVL